MITFIALLTGVLAYVAGRIHGFAAHKQFIATGFRLMSEAARRDGQHFASTHDLATRPVDVSNAFGAQDRAALHMVAVTHPINLRSDR